METQNLFGQFVAMESSGGTGNNIEKETAFDVYSSEMFIGRDKKCEIFIDSKVISRQHAKISIDENGFCILENLSHTNPTLLNNEKLCGSVRINNEDKVTIGNQSFIYRVPTTNFKIQSAVKEKLPSSARKSLPAMLLHDVQNISTDLGKQMNDKNTLATPLKEAIESRRKSCIPISGSKQVSHRAEINKSPRSSPRANKPSALADPIKQAILARRKSHFPEPTLQTIHESQDDNQDELCDKVLNVNTISVQNQMTLEIKNAIHSRRVSYSPRADANQNDNIRESQSESSTSEFESKKALLASPLKRAINARRKSISIPVETKEVIKTNDSLDVAVLMKKSLATPLKQAILARRRQSIQPVTAVNESETIISSTAPVARALNTPLKQAINSRRKSILPDTGSKTCMTTNTLETSTVNDNNELVIPEECIDEIKDNFVYAISSRLQEQEQEQKIIANNIDINLSSTTPMVVVPENEQDLCHLLTTKLNNMNEASRPKSIKYGRLINLSSYSSHASLPFRNFSDKNPLFRKKNIKAPTIVMIDEVDCDSNSVTEDDEMETNSNNILSSSKSPLPLKAHHIRFDEDGIATIVQATCTQMEVDAFAIELQRLHKSENMNSTDAYNESVSFFLHQSNNEISANKNRRTSNGRRNSLESSFLDSFSQYDGDSEVLACELVKSLNDSEINLIEAYSDRLVQISGMDSNDAYQMSLDSYVQGIDNCQTYERKHRDSFLNENPMHQKAAINECVSSHIRWDAEGDVIQDVEIGQWLNDVMQTDNDASMNVSVTIQNTTPSNKKRLSIASIKKEELEDFSSSLRELFQTPTHGLVTSVTVYKSNSPHQSYQDIAYIMKYAEEMTQFGGVDPDIAYGIALDCFISDPIAFRVRLSPPTVISNSANENIDMIIDASEENIALQTIEPIGSENSSTNGSTNENFNRMSINMIESHDTPVAVVVATPTTVLGSPNISLMKSHVKITYNSSGCTPNGLKKLSPSSTGSVRSATPIPSPPKDEIRSAMKLNSIARPIKSPRFSSSMEASPKPISTVPLSMPIELEEGEEEDNEENSDNDDEENILMIKSLLEGKVPKQTLLTASTKKAPKLLNTPVTMFKSALKRGVVPPNTASRITFNSQKKCFESSTVKNINHQQIEEDEDEKDENTLDNLLFNNTRSITRHSIEIPKLQENISPEKVMTPYAEPTVSTVEEVVVTVAESAVVVEEIAPSTEVENIAMPVLEPSVAVIEELTAPAPVKRGGNRKRKQDTAIEVEEVPASVEEIVEVTKEAEAVAPVVEITKPASKKRVVQKKVEPTPEEIITPVTEVVVEIEAVEEIKTVATKGKGRKATKDIEVQVVVREEVVVEEPAVTEVAPVVTTSSRSKRSAAVAVTVTTDAKTTATTKKGKDAKKVIEVEEEEEEIALLCDGCDAEVLLSESGLEAIPEGDWFCTDCSKAKTTTKGKKINKAPAAGKRKAEVVPVTRTSSRRK